MTTAAAPSTQNAWVGTRIGPITIGCSPENGGSAKGWLPQVTNAKPSIIVNNPTVNMRTHLNSKFASSAGTNVPYPRTISIKTVGDTAAGMAASNGHPHSFLD